MKVIDETTLYVDADTLIHKAFYASQNLVPWFDDVFAVSYSKTEAFGVWEHWQDGFPAYSTFVYCLSDPSGHYWRHTIWPEYKGKRGARSGVFTDIRAWFYEWVAESAHRDVVWEESLEADDLIGIAKGAGYIVYSQDKDLLTVPGLYLTDDVRDEPLFTTEHEAERTALMQCITGDSVDNIPGIPGMGSKLSKMKAGPRKCLQDALSCGRFDQARTLIEELWAAHDTPLSFPDTYAIVAIPRSIKDLDEKRVPHLS